MSLELRARAAAATMELFGFNPHQRRGPDGRFIKMADNELKRPRRKGRAGGAGDNKPPINLPNPEAEHSARRAAYNGDVLFFAQSRIEENRLSGKRDKELENYAEDVELASPNDIDEAVDHLRIWLNMQYAAEEFLDPAPPPDIPPLPTLPAGDRTPGGPRPPEDAPYEQRRAALDNSIRSGINSQSLISGGAMGDTRRFQLADGTSAIYKRAHQDWYGWDERAQTDAEELAAVVASAVGARAPAIQRSSDNELYMEVVPGFTAASRGWRGGSVPAELLASKDAVKVGLLDVLINNQDRHTGNWMVDGGEDIYAIDHGLAFKNRSTRDSAATISPFATAHFIDIAGEYQDNPLTAADVSRVREELSRVAGRFRELSRPDWFTQAMMRLDQIGRRATGTVDVYD